MNTPLFFFYWIAFTVIILFVAAIAFIWSRKKGYFRHQDRARYLALWAEVPEEKAIAAKTFTTETQRHGETREDEGSSS